MFPGEDLENAHSGFRFPTDLSEKTVVISVESETDNSPTPFIFKPLVGNVNVNARNRILYSMYNSAGGSNPAGTVTRP